MTKQRNLKLIEEDQPVPAAEPSPQPVEHDPGAKISDSMWYVRTAPERDEQIFQALLAEMRKEYASPTLNPEVAVWDDHTCRGLTSYPFPDRFSPDGLLQYANKIRGPFTYNGRFTQGGLSRAKFLLCRERLMAGTITNRQPDWTKLKDHMPPTMYEMKTRSA